MSGDKIQGLSSQKVKATGNKTKLTSSYTMTATAILDQDVPPEFICPITQELIVFPVMSRYGLNYERQAILEWLQKGNPTCPMTRKPLRPSMLLPNVLLF